MFDICADGSMIDRYRMSIWLWKELEGGSTTDRVAARHAGHVDPEDAGPAAAARRGDRRPDRAGDTRDVSGRAGISVPCPAPHGGTGLAEVGLGRDAGRAPGEVLRADARRTQTTGGRDPTLEDHIGCGVAGDGDELSPICWQDITVS